MLPSRSSRWRFIPLVLAACGPAATVHPTPVATGCPAGARVTLAGQDDIAALAGCTAIGGMTIRTGTALQLAPLRRLELIEGDLLIGPSVGLQEVALHQLREVTGKIRVVANNNLHAIFLPQLRRAGQIEIDGNVALTTISMPKLETVTGSLVITHDAELELVELSSLTRVGQELLLIDNPHLVLIEAGKLTGAGSVRVESNALLPVDQADALRATAPAAPPTP